MIFVHVWSQSADPVQEVTELRQQLQSSEREKEMFRRQLTRKEAELTRAEETIRREQQQMRQLVRGLPQDFPFTGACVCVCVWGGGGGGVE